MDVDVDWDRNIAKSIHVGLDVDVNNGFGAGFKEGMDANVGSDWNLAELVHVGVDIKINGSYGAGFQEGMDVDSSTVDHALQTAELPLLTISSRGQALVKYPRAKNCKTVVPCWTSLSWIPGGE